MATQQPHGPPGDGKSGRAFRTIGEVSESLDVPQHVLRFWETRFSQIRPLKRGGNRRYYRPDDVELLRTIKTLLHGEGYTIKGVQKRLREQGVRSTVSEVLEPGAGGKSAVAQGGAPNAGLAALHAELAALRRLLD